MNGMEGTCSQCGSRYYGWALRRPYNQFCKCGGRLQIRRDGVLVSSTIFDIKTAAATELMAPRFILNEDVSLIKN